VDSVALGGAVAKCGSRTLTGRARCGYDGQGQAWVHYVASGVANGEHLYRTLSPWACRRLGCESQERRWVDSDPVARGGVEGLCGSFKLVKCGANATANSKDRTTPLHFSVGVKSMELRRELSHRACQWCRGRAAARDGPTFAERVRRIDLARLLLEHNADDWTPLHLGWKGRED